MDFRSMERMDAADESILREPYRPFYNIFGSKPILVKQYFALSLVFHLNAVLTSVPGAMTMTE